MSYRKIQDGGQLLSPSVLKEEDMPMEQPMTYFGCPKCGNPKILSCECRHKNWYCQCGWKHLNHPHESSGFRGKNINDGSILTKNIR